MVDLESEGQRDSGVSSAQFRTYRELITLPTILDSSTKASTE